MTRPKRARRRTPRRRAARGPWIAGLVAALLVGAVLGWWLSRPPEKPDVSALADPPEGGGPASPAPPPPREVPPAAATPVEPRPPSPQPVDEPEPDPPIAAGEGRIALVIDDLGRSVRHVEILESLGIPITYAVLPFESRTGEVVDELRRRSAEVFLHLPMEADGGADPGPGALLLSMPPEELRRRTEEALEAVRGAVGVNNHMGSGLSSDVDAMRAILSVLDAHGLGFLDSRTSPRTVAFREARALGIAAGERDVFLDVERDPDFIRGQFDQLLDVARRRGSAIAIGHPYPETFEVLGDLVPRARAAGFRFVAVREILAPATG